MACGGCKRKREDFRKNIEKEKIAKQTSPIPVPANLPVSEPIIVVKRKGKSKRAIWLRAKKKAERRARKMVQSALKQNSSK